MPQSIIQNLSLKSPKHLRDIDSFHNKTEMNSYDKKLVPKGFITTLESDLSRYQFDGKKWTPYLDVNDKKIVKDLPAMVGANKQELLLAIEAVKTGDKYVDNGEVDENNLLHLKKGDVDKFTVQLPTNNDVVNLSEDLKSYQLARTEYANYYKNSSFRCYLEWNKKTKLGKIHLDFEIIKNPREEKGHAIFKIPADAPHPINLYEIQTNLQNHNEVWVYNEGNSSYTEGDIVFNFKNEWNTTIMNKRIICDLWGYFELP